ncbi:RNA pseudouridine synthase 5 isoform X3 [Magnolia sinica]|uniref:RNA pseudouridine synthase 5 isoform X3 n=1 Tax=Magnolia sinica TaxID=86752 RepID=UPI00265B52D6|nr:RNA pseudouridine synthase 5 isoform X3 [Magnolia sinica]
MADEKAPTRNAFGEPWPDFNDGLTYTDIVPPTSTTACSLIEFYSSKYSNSAPLEGWLQRIRNGQITVDGQVVTDPDTTLRVGSVLLYSRLPWKEPYAPYLLEVLYEDDDMVAINKPSGLQVLPGGLFQQRTVLTQLRWLAEKSSALRFSGIAAAQESHPVPVHRLGRGTSGILLCAKTKLARARLAAYFADGTAVVRENRISDVELGTTRRISKIYRALATGIIDEDEVVVKQAIGMMRYPGVANGLYVASSSGKPAFSKVRVLERDVQGNCTLVQVVSSIYHMRSVSLVEIQSGRPHQIRIHLSFLGHPLLGDPLYGIDGQPKVAESGCGDDSFAPDGGYQRPTKPVPGDCGYHLHAHHLVLSHPTKNESNKEACYATPLQSPPSTCQYATTSSSMAKWCIIQAVHQVIEITAPLPTMLRAQNETE